MPSVPSAFSRRPLSLPDTAFTPTLAQTEAVDAGEGVVQIIAPAGSGKTTVLIERVRELRRRGVPLESILCLTFNKAAAVELGSRLSTAGVGELGHRRSTASGSAS
jgi:superfamily I DNA/RNA helicase